MTFDGPLGDCGAMPGDGWAANGPWPKPLGPISMPGDGWAAARALAEAAGPSFGRRREGRGCPKPPDGGRFPELPPGRRRPHPPGRRAATMAPTGGGPAAWPLPGKRERNFGPHRDPGTTSALAGNGGSPGRAAEAKAAARRWAANAAGHRNDPRTLSGALMNPATNSVRLRRETSERSRVLRMPRAKINFWRLEVKT